MVAIEGGAKPDAVACATVVFLETAVLICRS